LPLFKAFAIAEPTCQKQSYQADEKHFSANPLSPISLAYSSAGTTVQTGQNLTVFHRLFRQPNNTNLCSMRIATYNVNGISARLPVLLRWLDETAPDVVCLQELKAPQEKFPLEAIEQAGYQAVWHGQKSWNGVAILSRGQKPEEVRRVLPGDPEDVHSRYLEASVNGIVVGCLYLPNGNPAPGPKYDYKLQWLQRFISHIKTLQHAKTPVVLAGDYNIIPTPADVYKPERWTEDALFRPEVREAFQTMLSQGWTDAIRELNPKETVYTFWDYFRNAYGRNAGLRIDHLLLNSSLANRLRSAGVDKHVRGWEKSSDHAPVWIEVDE